MTMELPAATSGIALKSADIALANPAGASDREKLKGVAKQFEGIFLRQMLASARKTSFDGKDGLFSGQAMETFTQMQDERFADIASETGTFGLAKMIESHLARFVGTDTAGAAAKQEATGNVI